MSKAGYTGRLSLWKAYCTRKMRRTVEKTDAPSLVTIWPSEWHQRSILFRLLCSLIIYTGGKNLFCHHETFRHTDIRARIIDRRIEILG